MTTTTDPSAALREAAKLLDSYSEIGFTSERAAARAMSARLVALADAPPTVAELLPRVDATHEVHWEAHGEERRVYAPDGGTLATEYRTSRTRWTETRLTVFDLRRPARLVAAREDCHAHRVDWRARALAAEAERSEIVSLVSPSSDQSLPDAVRELCEHVEDLRDDAQQWRNAVAGSQEPGDPVIRAIAALLACTYLDKLPTPPDDDFRRELAVAARIAHDKRRTAAAQWAKVAPLIERLRAECGEPPFRGRVPGLIECAAAILAATEVTP